METKSGQRRATLVPTAVGQPLRARVGRFALAVWAFLAAGKIQHNVRDQGRSADARDLGVVQFR